MAAGDIKLAYGTPSDVTITLAALGSSGTKLDGQESTALVNTTNLFTDYLVSGKVTVGTSPTASKSIEIWAVGAWDTTVSPLLPDGFSGVNSTQTLTSAEIKNSICKLVASMATTNNSDRTYPFGPVSLASLFGGVIPPQVVFFVTHDTGVALHATGSNHQIRIQPIYENVSA
jgi:hypothetical protein